MKEKFKWFFKEIGIYILAIIVILIIKQYVVALVRVNGSSMEDTLHNKDIMILDKISYKFKDIKRFDIVVIKEDDEYLIKRVIGLPGESLEYKNNTLYINGEKVKENFSHKKTDDFYIKEGNTDKIPEGYYFVLGDNRTNSMDSRILGFINEDEIIGKTSLTIFPFNRFGNKE